MRTRELRSRYRCKASLPDARCVIRVRCYGDSNPLTVFFVFHFYTSWHPRTVGLSAEKHGKSIDLSRFVEGKRNGTSLGVGLATLHARDVTGAKVSINRVFDLIFVFALDRADGRGDRRSLSMIEVIVLQCLFLGGFRFYRQTLESFPGCGRR